MWEMWLRVSSRALVLMPKPTSCPSGVMIAVRSARCLKNGISSCHSDSTSAKTSSRERSSSKAAVRSATVAKTLLEDNASGLPSIRTSCSYCMVGCSTARRVSAAHSLRTSSSIASRCSHTHRYICSNPRTKPRARATSVARRFSRVWVSGSLPCWGPPRSEYRTDRTIASSRKGCSTTVPLKGFAPCSPRIKPISTYPFEGSLRTSRVGSKALVQIPRSLCNKALLSGMSALPSFRRCEQCSIVSRSIGTAPSLVGMRFSSCISLPSRA